MGKMSLNISTYDAKLSTSSEQHSFSLLFRNFSHCFKFDSPVEKHIRDKRDSELACVSFAYEK